MLSLDVRMLRFRGILQPGSYTYRWTRGGDSIASAGSTVWYDWLRVPRLVMTSR